MYYIQDILTETINRIKVGGSVSNITEIESGKWSFETDAKNYIAVGIDVFIGDFRYTVTEIAKNIVTITGTETPVDATWTLALFFRYGHRLEIDKIINDEKKDPANRNYQFPLVWLLLNYEQRPSEEYDIISYETDIDLVFVNITEKDYIASQRLENQFKKVLDIVYAAVFYELNRTPVRSFFRNGEILGSFTDRYFYGSFDKKENVFNSAYTDARECTIPGLKVKKKVSGCTLPNTGPINSEIGWPFFTENNQRFLCEQNEQGLKVSEMTLAGSVTGAEIVPILKDGVNYATTLQKIADLAPVPTIPAHNGMDGLNDGDYQHLTAAQLADFVTLTGGGETTLHTHPAATPAGLPTTIGTGGQYANIGAAFTAGKYDLKLISNITETADITTTTRFNIDLNGFTAAFATYNLTYNTTPSYSNIYGGLITFGYSAAKTLVIGNVAAYVDISGCRITNNSTVADCPVTSLANLDLCFINLPNKNDCGIGRSSAVYQGKVTRTKFNGGGAACYNAYYSGNIGNIENCDFEGTYQTNQTVAVVGMGADIRYNSATAASITAGSATATCTNIIDIQGTLTLVAQGPVTNFICKIIASNGTSSYFGTPISNGTVTSATTVTIDFMKGMKLNNVKFASSVIIGANTNDNISLIGCTVGNTTGGTKKFTINAGANRTLLMGCRTEAATENNGTGTVESAPVFW